MYSGLRLMTQLGYRRRIGPVWQPFLPAVTTHSNDWDITRTISSRIGGSALNAQRLNATDQSLPTIKNAYLSESEEFLGWERTGFDEL
jgi:hypothetical protein